MMKVNVEQGIVIQQLVLLIVTLSICSWGPIDPISQERIPSKRTFKLPDPVKESDYSLEEVLNSRRSVRSYKKEPLILNEISQILWAAQGKTGGGGRG